MDAEIVDPIEIDWILRLADLPFDLMDMYSKVSDFLNFAVSTLENRPHQFQPVVKNALRHCILALGQSLPCEARIATYHFIGTLAEVAKDEMPNVYSDVIKQIQHDIKHTNCKYMERTVIHTLGTFAEFTGNAFREHLPTAFKIVCLSIHNHDEVVRCKTLHTLTSILLAFKDQGCTIQGQRAYKSLVLTLASLLRKDNRILIVINLIMLLNCIFSVGMPAYSLSDREVSDPIFECIRDMMAKKLACQEEKGEEADKIAMCGSDLFSAYGLALDRALFAIYFEELHGSFAKYLRGLSAMNRSTFYMMVSNSIKNLDSRAVSYYEFLLTVLRIGLREPDMESRQYTYYGIGLLISRVKQMAVQDYPEIQNSLLKACQREEKVDPRIMASWALANMIVANLQAVPLDQVVPTFMSCLPPNKNVIKNKDVLAAFWMLYNNAHASVMNYIELMLQTTIRMLHENWVIKTEYIKTGEAIVNEIMRTYPDKFNKVSMEFPEWLSEWRQCEYMDHSSWSYGIMKT